MAAGQPQGGPSVRDRHREWLELVDAEGPFLALPVITRVWPQGMPQLDDRAKSALVAAKPIFERAWDVMDRLGAAYTKGGTLTPKLAQHYLPTATPATTGSRSSSATSWAGAIGGHRIRQQCRTP